MRFKPLDLQLISLTEISGDSSALLLDENKLKLRST